MVQLSTLVRTMRDATATDGLSDAVLLSRFARGRDEAAFELLVWRHGAAVLAACKRILRHDADAEDAFQAAFLMLARKARGITRSSSVPAWLHRVATRFALRIASTRRPTVPIEVHPAAPADQDSLEGDELLHTLDREIERLNEKHRTAVVLVYLNGLTSAEAARMLNVPTGTVESRLAAARRILHRRLTARGVALLTTLAPAALAPSAAATTVRAAAAFAHHGLTAAADLVGLSPVHLAREAIQMGRLRTLAAMVAFLSVAAIAAGAMLRSPETVESASAPAPLEQPDAPKPPDDPRLKKEWWGEALDLGTLGKSYSYFQALSPDGKRMLVQHHGQLLCVEIAEHRVVWSIEAKGLWNAVYSPDGRTIATAQWENGANLFDAESGKAIAVFVAAGNNSTERPDQVGFLPDGKLVVHTSYSTYREVKDEPPLPDGSPKIVSTFRYSLIVWDPATKKEVRRTAEELTYGNSNMWQWMKGGAQILQTLHARSEKGTTAKQTLTHVDPRTGKRSAEIEIDKNDERAYDMSPDGKTVLLVKGMDGPRLIDAATGKLVMKLAGHRAFVTAGAFSPDGKLIVTASGTSRPRNSFDKQPDGPAELLIRDTVTGAVAVRFEYQPSKYDFTKVGFSPDGDVIYAVTKDHKIVVWGKLAFPRPVGGQFVGLPVLPEPPEPKPFSGIGGVPPAGLNPLQMEPDTLKKLVESLPKSGRPLSQQVDALFAAALGRLPTEAESKSIRKQLGEKPTAEKWETALKGLTATPEFLIHVNSLIQRVNGKNGRLNPLVPNFGDP